MTDPIRIHFSEPREAHTLEWLPLAVRYKLNAAGRKVRLAEWQALAMNEEALLACPAGARFEALLLGLLPNARRQPAAEGSYREYLRVKLAAGAAVD